MDTILIFAEILIFLFGIVIGSFLNVCIYRIPKGEDIVKVNSHCMTCGYQLKWYDLIPIFSYIFLRGKSESVKQSFPANIRLLRQSMDSCTS